MKFAAWLVLPLDIAHVAEPLCWLIAIIVMWQWLVLLRPMRAA